MIEFSSVLYYDESSPSCIRWKTDRFNGRGGKHISAGDVAGHLSKIGYYTVNIKNKAYYVHRVVMALHGFKFGNLQVDHIDRDKSNCKISNLRIVDNVTNRRNSPKLKTNTSGVNGVVWNKTRFSTCAVACWQDGKRQMRKGFSVGKHGLAPAFKLACEYRRSMIDELNSKGASYSRTHGE